MPAFLTDDWFSTVETLTAQAGNLNLPPALANLAINLVVADNAGNTELNKLRCLIASFFKLISVSIFIRRS